MTIRTALPLLAVGALALLGGRTAGAGPMAPAKDIVDTAVAAGSFNTLVTAVKAAGLVETLKGAGPFTVFAPTDAAFAKVPAEALKALLADKAALTAVLTYHVVAGKVPAAEAQKLSWAPTVQGTDLRVTKDDKGLMVDGARIVTADIMASNGIIHVIDTVVMPRKDLVDTAVGAGSFKTLVAAVQAAGLVETLKSKGPFTVFAPTDDAFGMLPEGAVAGLLKDVPQLKAVLTYHVLASRVLSSDLPEGTHQVVTVNGKKLTVVKGKDGSVTVDGAKVLKADVLAGNGVIHVLEKVVLPQ